MKSLHDLQELRDESSTAIARMEGAATALNALITRLESDASRSRAFTLEAVEVARSKALPAMGRDLDIVRAAAKTAGEARRFWESVPLLLSRQRFDDNPAADAQIKANWRAELDGMPAHLLQLVFEDARAEGDLPLLWLTFATGQRRSEGNAGFARAIAMSLEGVVIPDQAQALAAIAVADANVGHGEMIGGAATGLRMDPVRRMNIGRQQEAASRLVSAADALATRG